MINRISNALLSGLTALANKAITLSDAAPKPAPATEYSQHLFFVVGFVSATYIDNRYVLLSVQTSLEDAKLVAKNALATLRDEFVHISIFTVDAIPLA